MAQTPFRQPGKDLEVTDGNVVTGADDAQGGDLVLEGGTSSSGNNDAGDVVIRPGLPDGSGARGIVNVTNNGGADTDPILQLTSESGANVEDIRVFVGDQDPNGVVSGNPGDLYATHSGASSTLSVNTGSGDGNVTWTDLQGGGTGGAQAGIPGVIYGKNLTGTDTVINKLYMDAGDRNSYPGSGTTVTDLTGSRSGTKTTTVQVQNGHFDFNGASGSINFGTDANIEDIFDGGGTLIAWFRADGAGEASLGRIAGTANNSNNFGWFFCIDSPSGSTYRLLFRQNFSGAPAYGDWNTTSTLNLYEWYCFAITYDADSTANDPTFYINGVLETANQITTPGGTRVTDNGYPFVVGNRSTNDDRTWDGAIDMVMLFDEELTAEEIRQIYRVTGEDRLRASLVGADAQASTSTAMDVDIIAGDGGSTSGGGGNINLKPGDVTSGTRGIVKATHVGADIDPIFQLETTGTNGEDIRMFVGDRDPDGTITGNPGDVYFTHSGASSIVSVNTGAGDSNTTWTDLTATGTGGSPGIEGVIWGNNQFYIDAGDRNSYAGSGATWTDIIGSRSATMTNYTITDGHIIFNGTTNTTTATFTSDSSIEDIWVGGGTLIAWVRADNGGASNLGRIASTANSTDTLGWYASVYNLSGNTWRLYFRQNFTTTDGEWRTTSTLNLDEWVMIAITYNSSATANDPTLYINGILDTTDEIAGPVGSYGPESGANLDIGRRGGGGYTWGGAIEIVMLFDTELSEHAIRQIYRVTGEDRLRPGMVGASATDASQSAQPIDIIAGDGGTTAGTGGAVNITAGSGSQGDGGAVNITGGTTTDFLNDGGDINIIGGTSNNYSSRGGDIYITGGEKATAHSGDGGDINITGGSKTTGNTSGNVGAVTIKTGTSTGTASYGSDLTLEVASWDCANSLGHLVLQGASNTYSAGTGPAGNIYLYSGDCVRGTGGSIILTAGDSAYNGWSGGPITVTTGSATGGYSGTLTLQVPAAGATTRGTGDINITIGDTQNNYTSQPAGDIFLTGGDHTGTTGTAKASSIFLTAGYHAGNEAGSYPGDIDLTAGNQTGTSSAAAGSITLTAGNKTAGNGAGGALDFDAGSGNGSGAGGGITVTAGLAGSTGTGGAVDIDAGGSGAGATGTGGAVTIDGGTCNATNGAGGNVTVTSGAGSGTGNAGVLALSGNDGGATSGTGGDASLSGGEGGGTGRGGNLSLASGPGGSNGAGGTVWINAGGGGASAGAAGTISIAGGDGGAATIAGGAVTFGGGQGNTTGAGGLATVQGGVAGATGVGGGVAITGRAGGSTSGAGGAVAITAGNATSGNGGSITATAGDAGTSGDGGSITLTAGSKAGANADGNVSAFTDEDGSFQHRTQTTGFTGTQCDHKTFADQIVVNASASNQTVVTLGTLDTNGRNMKIELHLTAGENGVDTEFIGYQYSHDYYRTSGTVTSTGTPHVNSQNKVGDAEFVKVTFSVAVSGDDIELQVSNTSSSDNFTLNIALFWWRQEGGFAS